MSLTPPNFDKAEREKREQLEKKSVAYDNYIKQAEEGKIVVLTTDEIDELVGMFMNETVVNNIVRFIEQHSNWKRR